MRLILQFYSPQVEKLYYYSMLIFSKITVFITLIFYVQIFFAGILIIYR